MMLVEKLVKTELDENIGKLNYLILKINRNNRKKN